MIEIAIASGAGGLVGMILGLRTARNSIEKDEIPETLDCPGCSRNIERGAFCRHCGEYLSWEERDDEPVEAFETEEESLSLVERVASLVPVEIEIEDESDDESAEEIEEPEPTETDETTEQVERQPTTDGGERDDSEDGLEEILGEDGAEQVDEILEAVEGDDEPETTETTETESLGDETPDETREYVEIEDSDIDDGRTVYRGDG